MKTIIKTILPALVALLCLPSCKEDSLKPYNGDNYIHFTPNSSDKVEHSYNFALGRTTREEKASIEIPVRLWGYLPEKDFVYKVSVSTEGTTAAEGDYDGIADAVFRKGLPMDTLILKVNRRPGLLDTDFTIALHLDSAEEHVAAPSSYLTAKITVTDKIVVVPSWWSTTNALGAYSDIKFRLLNFYLGRYLGSLDGYTTITLKEEALRFKAWWKQQWDEGRYHYYDSDGTTPLYLTIPD